MSMGQLDGKATGRGLWLAVPVAVVIIVAASSPAVSQRAPRFLFPALAALGGGFLVRSLARSLSRLARAYRHGGRYRVLPTIVSAVATLLLVVLPLARLAYLLTPSGGRDPKILAGFGDWRGAEGYPRMDPHRGIDVAGRPGSDVLAAADGRVTVARDSHDLCGLIVAITHEPHGYRTVYCHLSVLSVTPGQIVIRGQRIGALGTTGQRAWPGYEHVHMELQRGADLNDLHDPVPRIAGCFEDARSYPTDRLVLTYPVRC